MKFIMDKKYLQTIYFSFIRPFLEYADVVWDNCTQQQINKLDKMQIEAGRIVSGTTKLVAIDKLYRELGWLKLSERRKLHKLFLFYKMQNGLAPDYLIGLVPHRVWNETPYSLRNADNYQQVHATSRLYFDLFIPSTIREWNNLPADVKSDRDTPKIPKYYFFGDGFNQILHTRLRTECSTLKFHLYRRNLIPEPYCSSGAVENTSHFLFICPKFNAVRRELVHTVSNYVEPSEAVLLFGDDILSNEVIFRAVHKYIHQTKRFLSND